MRELSCMREKRVMVLVTKRRAEEAVCRNGKGTSIAIRSAGAHEILIARKTVERRVARLFLLRDILNFPLRRGECYCFRTSNGSS